MQTFTYVIKDELGIHARPAGLLVKEAKQFTSTITLECGGKKAPAKGLMGVMGMAVKQGNEVTVTVEGEDEEAAAAAMKAFFEANL
ncbi:MAG: HPr family phosphocarrier protein [Agathobacter sp.]|nr:HPr family phosphocarrier protein [Agathobacter sp.]MBQ3030463.1 HPr family phosphocarrier protein [Agathobacter sp.]MBQ6812241.1 HPr family phosphocarrier protein [Agathobacter sp.]